MFQVGDKVRRSQSLYEGSPFTDGTVLTIESVGGSYAGDQITFTSVPGGDNVNRFARLACFYGLVESAPIKLEDSGAVEHPSHYNAIDGIECIDVVQHFNFNVGNVIKYAWRAGLKSDNPVEDLKKARTYIGFELARLDGDA